MQTKNSARKNVEEKIRISCIKKKRNVKEMTSLFIFSLKKQPFDSEKNPRGLGERTFRCSEISLAMVEGSSVHFLNA